MIFHGQRYFSTAGRTSQVYSLQRNQRAAKRGNHFSNNEVYYVTAKLEATVKTWLPERYFGFASTGTADIFFHGSELERAGIMNIAVGDRIKFNVTNDPKTGRPRAADIEMVM
jgi:cold shock protein